MYNIWSMSKVILCRGGSTGVATATLKNSLATPVPTSVGSFVLKEKLWLIGHLWENISNVRVQVNAAQDASLALRGGRYHNIWIRTDTKYFRASKADTDIDTDTF